MSAKDLLNQIEVKTPCMADWDSMIGNDQVRFCEHCNLSVHNLSPLTRKRVLRLVANSRGRLCVRYLRRPEGSLVTRSIPKKLYHISRRASRVATGAFSATLSLSNAVAQPLQTVQSNSSYAAVAALRESAYRVTQSSPGGSITGTITDPNGAVIAGATVSLANAQTNFAFSMACNDEGKYRFESLEPGTYSLRIEAPGFTASEVSGIVLGLNADHRVDQRLEVQTATMGGMVVIVDPAEPLVKAALDDDLQGVLALLAGSNVNVRDESTGTTALEHAVRNGNREMVQVLLSADADVNSQNASKETVLMMLREEGSSDIAWDLINAGAKVNVRDEDGDTALIEAAMVNNVGVLNTLLIAGAKVDARNDEGQTALMMAASSGLRKNVRALIAAGADINARDGEGKTPLNYAMENDSDKAVKLLQSYGAIEGASAKDK